MSQQQQRTSLIVKISSSFSTAIFDCRIYRNWQRTFI